MSQPCDPRSLSGVPFGRSGCAPPAADSRCDATWQVGNRCAGVLNGSAAAKAGLQAGDTVTGVNGTTISAPSDLSTAMANHKPGQQVILSWLDTSGQSHSATLTLGTGPAD